MKIIFFNQNSLIEIVDISIPLFLIQYFSNFSLCILLWFKVKF